MSRIYEVTVEAGQDLKGGITDYVLKQGWTSVYISGAVGSVIDMAYTTPVRDELPLKTVSRARAGAAEMLSFTGEVMTRERMDPALESIYPDKECPLFVHIHVSCAYNSGESQTLRSGECCGESPSLRSGECCGNVYGGGLAAGKAFRSLRVFMIPLENE